MKHIKLIALFILLGLPLAVFAQTSGGGSTTTTTGFSISGLIPLAVPLVISLLKMLVPKLPSFTWPIIAPILGAVADIVLHFAGVSTMGPVWGALLGSAGVGVREIHDQLVQLINQPKA